MAACSPLRFPADCSLLTTRSQARSPARKLYSKLDTSFEISFVSRRAALPDMEVWATAEPDLAAALAPTIPPSSPVSPAPAQLRAFFGGGAIAWAAAAFPDAPDCPAWAPQPSWRAPPLDAGSANPDKSAPAWNAEVEYMTGSDGSRGQSRPKSPVEALQEIDSVLCIGHPSSLRGALEPAAGAGHTAYWTSLRPLAPPSVAHEEPATAALRPHFYLSSSEPRKAPPMLPVEQATEPPAWWSPSESTSSQSPPPSPKQPKRPLTDAMIREKEVRQQIRIFKNRAAAARSNARRKHKNDALKSALAVVRRRARELRDRQMALWEENLRLKTLLLSSSS